MSERRRPEPGTEIVLSAADPRMPAHLAGDWNTEALTPGGEQPAAASGRRGPLALLRIPERWLWRHYSRSRLHQSLHRSCRWYRELEEDWRLGPKLERLYGAASRPRHRLQRFVAGNLVATALLGLLVVQVGRAGVDALVDSPPPQRAETVATEDLQAPAEPTSPRVAATTPRLPDADLDHCSLSPLLRTSLASTDPATRQAAMSEIEHFQSYYSTSGVELRWQRHRQQLHLTTGFAQRLLPLVAGYHARLQEARSRLQSQRTELAAAAAGGSPSTAHDVAHINQRIKQRDALDRIDRTLAAGPTAAQLAALGEAVDTLAGFVEPGATRPYRAPRRSEPSAWVVRLRNMEAEQLGPALESQLQRDIRGPIAAPSSGSSTLDRYRADTVTAALAAFNQLLAIQQRTPLSLARLDRQQAGSNDRLSGLLAMQPDGGLLDYRHCLDGPPASSQLSASR